MVLFVFISFYSFASDNVTVTSLYSVANLTAYSDSQISESYSHAYMPNSNIKSGVENYFNLKSQGNGMTRAHNIVSVDSVGNAYVSSYVGYNAIESSSYMTSGDKTGFQSCCSTGPCNEEYDRVATRSAMGYSAKLHNGFVEQSMIANPGPYPSSTYNTYSESMGSDNKLDSGVSISSANSSGNLTQNYENHISVSGQFKVYSTAETQ